MIKRASTRNAYIAGIIFCLVLILYAYPGNTAEPQTKGQAFCPVMGGKIDKSIHIDYEGNRIYFCCSACPDKFKEDPEGFINKMTGEGIVLEKLSKGNAGKSQCLGRQKAAGKHQCTKSQHSPSPQKH